MLVEIPLQAVSNQVVTVTLNQQTFNIALNTISVNNKTLQNNTSAYEPRDEIINNILVPKSSLFVMATIKLGNTLIVSNAFCNNATYLNYFTSNINGYLFFYIDNWQNLADTKINYKNFGNGGSTHLYYADYDALNTDYLTFVNNNYVMLEHRFEYGYNQ